ncbi:hypothetical protein CTAYLR_010698 [Chrysophaeum taylorii]|uniref:Major facilitator superfamily (MFS) profile domain-containing protein n=1 Tax=Chrysophaeum taylorii TaxID=2483200 RepID=A0AAD7XKA1_9STRA|nr:hypothetical protein CTAYLR_010698 [Chrysophaeum taylorii]
MGLPWRAVLVLGIGNMAHFYTICSLFSYAGFLTVELGWSSNVDRAGFVAGWLGTSLTLGRLPTAVLWGVAADRYGRRPCILLCFLSLIVGNILFGTTRSLRTALLVRFVFLGMGNGWVTIQGTVAGEIAGKALQSEVTAWMMASGSAVQLLGPAVAALLYGLAWPSYPALAPSLLGAGIAALAFGFGLAWLPETAAASGTSKQKESTTSPILLFGNSAFAIGTALRVVTGVVLFSTFDVLPLWGIASRRSGGLALSRNHLALVLCLSATAQLCFNIFVISPLVRALGHRSTLRVASVAGATALAAIPLVGRALCHESYPPQLAALTPLVATFYSSGSLSFTAVTAIINNSVPDDLRGAANGIATFFEAFGKAAGPTLGATAFAVSIATWPGLKGAAITFLAMASALYAAALATFKLHDGQ